jgi:hypothetical protein
MGVWAYAEGGMGAREIRVEVGGAAGAGARARAGWVPLQRLQQGGLVGKAAHGGPEGGPRALLGYLRNLQQSEGEGE